MIEIMTVCTGNICRSPIAEVVLRARLEARGVAVSSAGTQGLPSAAMTDEAQRIAVAAGADPRDAAGHRSRFLTEAMLSRPDVVLALSREHRTRVLSLWPAATRRTFTVREFARLAATLSDAELLAAADPAAAPEQRLRQVATRLALARGIARRVPPADDDVIDPYRQSREVYEHSAGQLLPAIDQVVRVVELVA